MSTFVHFLKSDRDEIADETRRGLGVACDLLKFWLQSVRVDDSVQYLDWLLGLTPFRIMEILGRASTQVRMLMDSAPGRMCDALLWHDEDQGIFLLQITDAKGTPIEDFLMDLSLLGAQISQTTGLEQKEGEWAWKHIAISLRGCPGALDLLSARRQGDNRLMLTRTRRP